MEANPFRSRSSSGYVVLFPDLSPGVLVPLVLYLPMRISNDEVSQGMMFREDSWE